MAVMWQVLEEEEMADLLAQQRRYLAARAVELAEQQRLEEQERRLREETDRRIADASVARRHQAEAKERVAAAALVRGHLEGLLPSVLRGLADAGVLVDDVRADVIDGFLPWLADHVEKRVGSSVQGREVLDDILKQVLIEQRRVYSELGERRLAGEKVTLVEPPHTETSPAETSNLERSPAASTTEEPSIVPPDPADIPDQSSDPEATVRKRSVPETNRQFSDILEEPEDIEDA
ncbi:hypothetical protein PR048_019339 [Dryococelus australis]|uniref:Uncharacterized protein n=1 Tax=Dryococelus australis TaxID=614101 RepID=A0ABQ9H3J7_9NEOP|nr:hypothetical protein PR048_019339 [Dryococelus australis]